MQTRYIGLAGLAEMTGRSRQAMYNVLVRHGPGGDDTLPIPPVRIVHGESEDARVSYGWTRQQAEEIAIRFAMNRPDSAQPRGKARGRPRKQSES